jgi:N-acylglucosamine-6-phosphate 2-epimerase
LPSEVETSWQSLKALRHKLVVSCQASRGEPLCAPEHIRALALTALAGGAAGLRLEGAENIRCVREATSVPIVGLTKSPAVADDERLHKVYITATFAEAAEIAKAGADVIAVDATARPRPDGLTLAQLIDRIHKELMKPVWADVATLDEGLAATAAGADVVSTTMSGYTAETYTSPESGPDLDLLAALSRQLSVPVILEGRVWYPDEVKRAFALGAYTVVVGSAITRPALVTQRFARACPAETID